MGNKKNASRIWVGKPEEKRQIERPRRRLDNNIKMDLRGGMDWIDLAQDRDQLWAPVNSEIKLRVP
jgi:hypothetical protein